MTDSKLARAVVATGYGGPEVLSLVEVPIDPPGPGEVLIDVRAAGTNPYDYKSYSGEFGRDPAKLPMRLGREASGVVAAVGEGAEGPAGALREGDPVIAYPVLGAYASLLVAPATSVLPKPAALSFEQASGLMLTGATAFHALQTIGVAAGDVVVVHGAAGGVGLMAVQLARAAGARVIGTAKLERHASLREFGAEPVTYGPGLIDRIRALAPNGLDAAIDTAGSEEALDVSIELVPKRERIVTIIAFQRGLELGVKVIGNAPGADPGTAVRDAARLELVRLAEASELRVLVAASYPLAEAADAHRALASGHSYGKIVLVA
jgi:NADPH:quinone reductase-like Zn-dependent oxidoreductase